MSASGTQAESAPTNVLLTEPSSGTVWSHLQGGENLLASLVLGCVSPSPCLLWFSSSGFEGQRDVPPQGNRPHVCDTPFQYLDITAYFFDEVPPGLWWSHGLGRWWAWPSAGLIKVSFTVCSSFFFVLLSWNGRGSDKTVWQLGVALS